MPDAAAQESKAAARNAFSKISGMFGRGQKPRWIQDFHILFSHSDPNRRYKSGDVVRGEVHIRPSKPVRVTHITLALYGYAQVFKNFNAPGEGQSKEASHADPGRLLTSPGIVKLFTPVERTLHGECKLPSRLLKFQFAIPLPSHRLPTSIDFERGTISYQLVATITRPTAIAPVLRCEPRKLFVNEDIDVALIPAPKPRMVTLEPLEPKSKTRRRKKTGSNSPNADNASVGPQDSPDSPRSSTSHSRSGSRASFTQSDNASLSNCSASIEFRINSNNSSNSNSGGGSNRNSRSGTPANNSKVIHASAEVTRGGFLPGDKIPVRVLVTHTKPIRSMCGVIVTLYRKTHIDTQPVLHKQVVDANGQTTVKAITPDVYTRSLTGLGGLSLSNSGTSQTYRMDIAQAAVPLLINPQTLQADVTTNVEIPLEGITPTITKVRGESIDFRYYIEVCLDLQGKLEISRFLPRLTAQPRYGFGKPSAGTNASVPLNLAAQGAHLIDTQLIRRERSQIIAWQFHVVVGTKDSGRSSANRHRGGWKAGDGPILITAGSSGGGNGANELPRSGHLSDVQEDWNAEESVSIHRAFSEGLDTYDGADHVHEIEHDASHSYAWNHSSSNLSSAPTTHGTPPLPPPMPPSLPMPEEPVDEKTRLKQQEERLMPSAPPMDDGDAPGPSSGPPAPSAPPEDMVNSPNGGRWETEVSVGVRDPDYASVKPAQYDQVRPQLRQRPSHASHTISIEDGGHIQCSCGASRDASHLAGPANSQDASSSENLAHHHHHHHHHHQQSRWNDRRPPSVTSEPNSRRSSNARSVDNMDPTIQPTDDKQELERRRLMADQSAPTYEDPDEPGPSASAASMSAPSAPALGDLVQGEDIHTAFGDWDERHDELPRYER